MAYNAAMSAYGSSKYNTQNQHSVNTNSIPMYNGDMCLKISFMNDSMSIAFIAAVIKEDGTRSFPKENAMWCVIKPEYAVLLLNWLNQYFIPESKANYDRQIKDPELELDPVMVGIPLNRENSNMLVFTYDKPRNEALVPIITLHTGIGENRIPQKSASFEFGVKRIFTKYDPQTGDYAYNMDQVQFWVFMKILNHFVDAITYAESHADRVANSYVNREMRNLIRQIAQRNGIQTTAYTNAFDNPNGSIGAINASIPTSSNVARSTSVEAMFAVPGNEEVVSSGEDIPF
jgi:hypothetical protein